MLGNQTLSNSNEGSALAARGSNLATNDNWAKKGGRPWCDHCHKPSHTKDICWKLHDKPADWKPRQVDWKPRPPPSESRGFLTGGEEKVAHEITLFSKEQLDLLQRMFTTSSTTSIPNLGTIIGTGSVAHSGNSSIALSTQIEKYNPWTVDSGASHHITDKCYFIP